MAERDEDTSFWIDLVRGNESSAQALANSFRLHLARIDHYITEWLGGRLTVDEKRRAISDENKHFYGASCPRALKWP